MTPLISVGYSDNLKTLRDTVVLDSVTSKVTLIDNHSTPHLKAYPHLNSPLNVRLRMME